VDRGSIGVGLALLMGLVAPTAQAQRPHRAGLWIETGAGPGYVRIASSGSTKVTSAPGSTYYLRAGGLVSDKVLLGVDYFRFVDETFGVFRADTSSVGETWSLAAIVLWFPWRSGVFVKSGVGAAQGTFTVTPSGGSPVTARGTGVTLTFGLGYDQRISRKVALTGCLCADIAGIGDVVLPTIRVDDVIASIYHVTIGITIR